MFCQKCGNNVADGSTFCPVCGNAMPSPQPAQQVQPAQPTTYYQQAQPTTTSSPGKILAMGIVSLALSTAPLAGIASIILGALLFGKVDRYYSEGGLPSGQVKAGRGLGKAGLIVGIVFTVIWIIYFFGMIAAIKSGAFSHSIRYYY